MSALNRFYLRGDTEGLKYRKQSVGNCVFISHQKKDSKEAKKIADYIESAGVDIYFDAYDSELNSYKQSNNPKEITRCILQGINNCTDMLIIVSQNTLTSSWVPFEIGFGYDKTNVNVLCLKGIPKGGLPEYIRIVPIIRDIYDLNSFVSSKTKLLKEVMIRKSLLRDYNDSYNPLSDVMDNIINDQY